MKVCPVRLLNSYCPGRVLGSPGALMNVYANPGWIKGMACVISYTEPIDNAFPYRSCAVLEYRERLASIVISRILGGVSPTS